MRQYQGLRHDWLWPASNAIPPYITGAINLALPLRDSASHKTIPAANYQMVCLLINYINIEKRVIDYTMLQRIYGDPLDTSPRYRCRTGKLTQKPQRL